MFSALRIFRVFRVFKVISGVRQMRVILDAIFRVIPGIAWAAGVMALIYARMGCVPAPGARGQVENMRTGGVRDFCKIFPVLLFSCLRGPRTRRPRLRRNRGRDGPRGRPRKVLALRTEPFPTSA